MFAEPADSSLILMSTALNISLSHVAVGSLSLQPFEHPVCTPEGAVFDLLNIVPYLKKYGHNPVSGKVSLTLLV